MRPGTKVVRETVLLWVAVDVHHQPGKVSVGINPDALEGVLKEAAGATVGFVDRFGVGVEQVAELLRDPKGFPKPLGSLCVAADPKGFGKSLGSAATHKDPKDFPKPLGSLSS